MTSITGYKVTDKETQAHLMDIYSLLDAVPTTLANKTINYLMDFGQKQRFNTGDVIFREGDPSQKVFIILDGEASVVKGDAFGNSNVIAQAEKGSIFGEMGIFLNLHRSGTVIAKSDMSVLSLSNDDFLSALKNFPDLSLRLFKSLSIKLDRANSRLSNLLNAMCMVQVGTFILESQKSPEDSLCICNFDALSTETELKRRDIVNALINYNRLNIITDLKFRDDTQAQLKINRKKLSNYLKRTSLNPTKT